MFGDSVTLRTVSQELPEPESKTDVSVSDAQVQEALQVIDGVMTARGFTRNPLTAEDKSHGIIAFYGICGVSITINRLDIGFSEFHRHTSSRPVKEISNELKDKLSGRFGVQNVHVTKE